jgi:hypothetical protein
MKKAKLTSTEAQPQRMVRTRQFAKTYGASTFRVLEGLDIISPAKIVNLLRHAHSCVINTERRNDVDALGHTHKVAYYVLVDDNGFQLEGGAL